MRPEKGGSATVVGVSVGVALGEEVGVAVATGDGVAVGSSGVNAGGTSSVGVAINNGVAVAGGGTVANAVKVATIAAATFSALAVWVAAKFGVGTGVFVAACNVAVRVNSKPSVVAVGDAGFGGASVAVGIGGAGVTVAVARLVDVAVAAGVVGVGMGVGVAGTVRVESGVAEAVAVGSGVGERVGVTVKATATLVESKPNSARLGNSVPAKTACVCSAGYCSNSTATASRSLRCVTRSITTGTGVAVGAMVGTGVG